MQSRMNVARYLGKRNPSLNEAYVCWHVVDDVVLGSIPTTKYALDAANSISLQTQVTTGASPFSQVSRA